MVWGRQTGGPGNQIEIPVETGNPPDPKLTATQSNEGIVEVQIPVGIANQSHNLRVKAFRLCGEPSDGLLGHGRYQIGEQAREFLCALSLLGSSRQHTHRLIDDTVEVDHLEATSLESLSKGHAC